MTSRSSMKTFLRTVVAVAALGGIAVGLVLATNQSMNALRTGEISASDIAYLTLAGFSFLVLVAVVLLGRRVPVLLLALGFAALGAALSGLIHDFTGRTAEFVLWLSAFSFGGAVGVVLARLLRPNAG
jgi:alpha/beta superfamily hydrolase